MEAASGGAPRLRPLDLGGTLDTALKIVTRNARTLVLAVLVVVVPLEVLSLVIAESTTRVYDVASGFGLAGDTHAVYADEGAYAAGQAAITILAVLTSLLATVACFKAVAEAYLGRVPTPGSSLRFAARRLPAALWMTIVMVILLVPAFLALVVPGIWLAIAFSMGLPVLLTEDERGFGALSRSFNLVKGHWWRVFLTLLVAYILVAVVQGIVTAVLIALATSAFDSGSFTAHALATIARIIGLAITTPVLSAVTAILYFDLRVRKEGFSLDLLADRLGDSGPPAPTTTPAAPLYHGFAPPVDAPPAPPGDPPRNE
jgi:hypothetical protein